MDELEKAPAKPLFELDFGANGGILAPTTIVELSQWIDTERSTWGWIRNANVGGHRESISEYLNLLDGARSNVMDADRYQDNPSAFLERLNGAQNQLRAVFSRDFPHSSSMLGQRVLEMRTRSEHEAIAYLYVKINEQYRTFEPAHISAWHGFLTGLAERFDFKAVPKENLDAALKSTEALRIKVERQVADRNRAIGAAQRKIDTLSADIEKRDREQQIAFSALIENVEKTHADSLADHNAKMESLQETFRKTMALRAPVSYWESQRRLHSAKAINVGYSVAAGMSVLLIVVGLLVAWALIDVPPGSIPPAWKVAVLGFVGAIGFWAVRLTIRIFLSHRHLANDAAERVTMVKTYLALHEEGKIPADDDRKLVLGALFRTASDGIVKDDAVINPVLEAFTKPK